MKISVLDQSPTREGVSPDDSIRETLALARHCEALGYYRYWLSEHHSSDSVSGSAPEILLAAIGATTTRIRIGSAGIMLPHYSALKVAEQFRVLEAIAPGRVDLGVGRAPGSDGRTAFALNPNAATAANEFPAMLRDLQAWTSGAKLPDNHPYRMVRAVPAGPHAPEIWVLGSSDYGAQLAAYFGLPYCYAYFFNEGKGADRALELYRENFRPSPLYPKPHSSIAVWAFAAETESEADYHYWPRAIQRLMFYRGQFIPMPTPEAAAEYQADEADRGRIERGRKKAFCGTPDVVVARLREEAAALGVDELAIVSSAYDAAARQKSYTLMAREFGLSGALKASS